MNVTRAGIAQRKRGTRMNKYREDAYTLCPFYHKESAERLICEGVCDGASTMTLFPSSIIKARYQNRYCMLKYYDTEYDKSVKDCTDRKIIVR